MCNGRECAVTYSAPANVIMDADIMAFLGMDGHPRTAVYPTVLIPIIRLAVLL
jgi:hypothetical protein